jgi:hypothetical protein
LNVEFVSGPAAQPAVEEYHGFGVFLADRVELPDDVVGFEVHA